MPEFDRYLSPFSWRYGSDEMRALWSELEKRRLWRKIWVCLARAEQDYGLVSAEQVADLEAHALQVDMPRALAIEAEIHHDLMAELRTFAEQAPLGGGILHLGATSMDIEDNADALRLRAGLQIILERLGELLLALADKVEQYADLPLIAFTHLQPAEPSTLGYRLAMYTQDLAADFVDLLRVWDKLKGKGFKGAVGTAASYAELIGVDQVDAFEARLSDLLGLPFFAVATQTYPRRQDYQVISALAGMGSSLSKFAFDLRLMQSPVIGEWSEPFAAKQVGSSAMPFKRNPINAEKMNSLARSLSQMPAVAWNNAAQSLLERTLDDSANRRSLLPEAFLISDELLRTALRVVNGLKINMPAMERNLTTYAPFASTERVLMALVKAGADRQEMHERLRDHAMRAWQAVQAGQPNPLAAQISADEEMLRYLSGVQLADLMQVAHYSGIAPERARALAASVRELLSAKDAA